MWEKNGSIKVSLFLCIEYSSQSIIVPRERKEKKERKNCPFQKIQRKEKMEEIKFLQNS